ncbi:hypothetical protein ASG43_08910 [Aureimonas sp. Leaf454]|uniref:DNA-binding protein n=1 Tax=Aureimonas sp. Leaf454 TaxID=1736381 RepID=UPI0006FF4ABE|nr:DNA-binding protein [Aureimonas sp. Leaf454]KQT48943.1 hypothetical protein ASG43_08910 [Aureimonas sp. Leaf454]
MDDPTRRTLPPYWTEYFLTPAEVAEIIGTPNSTFDNWARTARLLGFDTFGKRLKGRRVYRPADLFAAGLMAAMYRLGRPIGADEITAAVTFGGDVPPDLGDMLRMDDPKGEGAVSVDAGLVYTGVRHFAGEIFDFGVGDVPEVDVGIRIIPQG